MVDIIAFGAHPDDIEFGCGGILATSAAQGYKVLFVDLTIGEKASNGNPEQRRKEGIAAAQCIGAQRLVLDFKDCEIVDNYEGRLKLVKVIREYKPRLVLGPMWKGEHNHPDHIACGALVRYACRFARFSQILPEFPPHTVDGILHYLPHTGMQPEILIDVSDSIDKWKQMMEAHQSQLKTHPYTEWVLKSAAHLGTIIGKSYAQGVVSGTPIVVEDIMSVSRGIRDI